VREIGRVLLPLKAEGFSILLVEQNLRLALRMAALGASEDVTRRFLGVA